MRWCLRFQSPSQRGANYFGELIILAARPAMISVPFSKGCQLLPRSPLSPMTLSSYFSPLLKGVPITSALALVADDTVLVFQSPSQRGANYFRRLGDSNNRGHPISVPFSKGCQLLPPRSR